MPRASRHADVPPPDLAALAGQVIADREQAIEDRARYLAIVARMERVAAFWEAGAPVPAGTDDHALGLLIQDGRQSGSGLHARAAQLERVADQLERLSMESRLAEMALSGERAEGRAEGRQEAAQARHSHRKPRGGRKTPDGQVIPFPGGTGKAVTAAAAAAAVTAALTLGPGAVSDLAHWSPAPAARHLLAASVPSFGPGSAVEIPSAVPAAYVPRHAKPSPDAASASPAPSPSVTLPPSSSPPPSPAPVPSVTDFDGQLDVQTDHLVIGPLLGGQVTFTAVGGSLSWSVSAPAGLVLSARSGILRDGQPVVITVSVAAGTPAGSGVIVITDGQGRSFRVPVSWAAVPGLAV